MAGVFDKDEMGKSRKTERKSYVDNGEVYIGTFDNETGQELSRTKAKEHRDSSEYFPKGEFFTMHERVCKMLKMKGDYKQLTFRVLFELLERIEYGNRIRRFTQKEIAIILGTYQPKVKVSLDELKDDNIIKKVGHDWYFTPQFIRYANDGFGHLRVDEAEQPPPPEAPPE